MQPSAESCNSSHRVQEKSQHRLAILAITKVIQYNFIEVVFDCLDIIMYENITLNVEAT